VSEIQEYDVTATENRIASEGFAWARNWTLKFGEPVTFNPLKQYFSVLRFDITNATESDATITEVLIKTSGDIAVTQNVFLNSMENGNPMTGKIIASSDEIRIKVKNGLVRAGKSIDVRAMINAGAISGQEFTVTVTSRRGVHPSMTFTAGSIAKGGSAVKKLSFREVEGEIDYVGEIPIDFSVAGYRYGMEELPRVPIRLTLEAPSDGSDATQMIQDALDKVQSPGAVLLKSGEYKVSSPINMLRNGVVLRGEGEGTVLKSVTTEQITVINLGPNGQTTYGSSSNITEDVPLGQMWVKVADPSLFSVGNTVGVMWLQNDLWIHDLKMDQMEPNEGLVAWSPSSMYWERVVTRVDGNKIYLDAPVVMSLEKKYSGKMALYRMSRDRISESGVEDLSITTVYDPSVVDSDGNHVDENHAWEGVGVRYAQDCWVSGVTSRHLGFSLVSLKKGARCVTVTDCASYEPVSLITGSRRYAFYVSGSELCLFKNCYAEKDRHGFVTNSRVCGPNVYLDCTLVGAYNGIGPHHRWATGTLFDNCKTDGLIELQDRGNWGTGHGWAGANTVLWNCQGKEIVCQSPWVSAFNWSVGTVGKKIPGRYSDRPDGIWISEGAHVSQRSLYEYQLANRRNLSGDTSK
jgi:hypothetical protein